MALALEGKRALVGGSSRGIGFGCAEALAAAGAEVIVTSRDADALEGARASLLAPLGQDHRAIAVDFSDWRSLREKVAKEI
ncbi:MAG: SDR family NAD(P)-dependent oxidoreductase, partial [Acidimicrobiia bacterium]